MLLNVRLAKRTAYWPLLLLLLTACLNNSPAATHVVVNATSTSAISHSVMTVQDAVKAIHQEPGNAPQQPLVIDASINQPPTDVDGSIAPPAKCPVVVARLPTLTDKPFLTEFSVAGAVLPNAIPQSLPSLELVIPFKLGIIDLPAHAELHGHVFDPNYASCPDAPSLFVLDSIANAVPRATPQPATNEVTSASWQVWTDSVAGLGLSYPNGWTVQTTHNVGSVTSAEFSSGDASEHVSLDVTAGETYWTQDSTHAAPESLQGQRVILAHAGQALARLVDVVGSETDQGHQRTIRIVFNYGGNTVILSTHFTDGTALDPQLLHIFTGMASSFHFDKPVGISDPMDPTLTANDKIGNGPFIGVDTAMQIAVASSGMTQTHVIDAKMVSEKAARETTPGVCREFQERPQAVWLVKLSGIKPTGETATMLVYLDAITGESICQTDVSGQS